MLNCILQCQVDFNVIAKFLVIIEFLVSFWSCAAQNRVYLPGMHIFAYLVQQAQPRALMLARQSGLGFQPGYCVFWPRNIHFLAPKLFNPSSDDAGLITVYDKLLNSLKMLPRGHLFPLPPIRCILQRVRFIVRGRPPMILMDKL